MQENEKLLLANKAWVQDRVELQDNYFTKLAASQQPQFLWIGCSDSQVAAEQLTGADPGEMFVHRNIANLVVPNDLNLLSVVQYAVEILEVKHVIVCGHYECGGIKTALARQSLGIIDQWLHNIRLVERQHKTELAQIPDTHDRFDRLVEFNVMEQIRHLAATDSVQKIWGTSRRPTLHGWVFNLRNGLLHEVIKMEPPLKK